MGINILRGMTGPAMGLANAQARTYFSFEASPLFLSRFLFMGTLCCAVPTARRRELAPVPNDESRSGRGLRTKYLI